MHRLLLWLFTTMCSLSLLAQDRFESMQEARQVFSSVQESTDQKVYACFYLADHFMDQEKYDSAQQWLNRIYEVYRLRKASLFNYMILSRQAEVYYYNNLLDLGLDVSLQALHIAEELGDSLLLADAYNFAGLFETTRDSALNALPFFHSASRYARQPPYPDKYLNLSKPHHIYGNLAEACLKLQLADSSIFYAKRSLEKAQEINWPRGIAVAYQNLGNAYAQKQLPDSALINYRTCREVASSGSDIDVVLVTCSGMALAYIQKHDFPKALVLLREGFALMQANPNINILFSRQFIREALQTYSGMNDQAGIYQSYRYLVQVDSISRNYNSRQVQNLIRLAGNAEKQLLTFEVAEARQKAALANTRLTLAIAGIILLLILSATIYYLFRQRLKMENWRNQVSQDLHDEVGGTLSGIRFMSELTQQKIQENDLEQAYQFLGKMVINSKEMTEKMGDIVWAVNPANDRFERTFDKLGNFARQIGGSKQIQVRFNIPVELRTAVIDFEKRKHVYLIAKEAITNAVKYSGCKNLNISLNKSGMRYALTVADDGCGFDQGAITPGNGLSNMQARARDILGQLTINTAPEQGTRIELIF